MIKLIDLLREDAVSDTQPELYLKYLKKIKNKNISKRIEDEWDAAGDSVKKRQEIINKIQKYK